MAVNPAVVGIIVDASVNTIFRLIEIFYVDKGGEAPGGQKEELENALIDTMQDDDVMQEAKAGNKEYVKEKLCVAFAEVMDTDPGDPDLMQAVDEAMAAFYQQYNSIARDKGEDAEVLEE